MDKKTEAIVEYMRTCPYLKNLLSIAGTQKRGNTIILPKGASETRQYQESRDINGNYFCDIIPNPSIYEDYQINCYELYDVKDSNPPRINGNIMKYEEVAEVCRWVKEQDQKKNFPDIGEKVVSVECTPFVPQIRYVDEANNVVCYFITFRIRYVNTEEPRAIEYVSET